MLDSEVFGGKIKLNIPQHAVLLRVCENCFCNQCVKGVPGSYKFQNLSTRL